MALTKQTQKEEEEVDPNESKLIPKFEIIFKLYFLSWIKKYLPSIERSDLRDCIRFFIWCIVKCLPPFVCIECNTTWCPKQCKSYHTLTWLRVISQIFPEFTREKSFSFDTFTFLLNGVERGSLQTQVFDCKIAERSLYYRFLQFCII